MHFFRNEILSWNDDGKMHRILWVDDGNIIAYLIDINDPHAMPAKWRLVDLVDALDNNDAKRTDTDPWARYITEEEIEGSEKEIRDQAWLAIADMVKEEPNIYVKSTRGNLVRLALENTGLSKPTIYKYLRRYWQRGMTINALLPDYFLCGGRGKKKTVGEKKRGRPRKYSYETGANKNVDADTEVIFETAYRRFYRNRKGVSLKQAYDLMIAEFYKDCELSLIPTFYQFKSWARKYKAANYEDVVRDRKGDKKFESDYRGVLGTSKSDVIGPGSMYQIDASVADIYLISRFNSNWIIGRPVLYLVVDVFSRMIVGLYIGLEGPSWTGAMMALANAMNDKVKFCNEYGIKISSTEWPCYHAPDAILGDRGELLSKKAETMVQYLQIAVKNASSYRPDMKGIVEQRFNFIKERVKPLAPGFVLTDLKERGGPDYRLDATLTIDDFTYMIIQYVRLYNRRKWIEEYELDEDMLGDDVQQIPIELWNWGIENRAGRLRTFSEDTVKLNLMLRDKARVTERGINFHRLRYSSSLAIEQNWFALARKSTWVVDISYDPRNMSNIYIRDADGRGFDTGSLLDVHEKYNGMSLPEIEYVMQVQRERKNQNDDKNLVENIDLIKDVENVVKSAREKKEREKVSVSKTSQVKGINKNRQVEKELNRLDEAFRLGEPSKVEKPSVILLKDHQTESEGLGYRRRVEKLKQRKDGNKNGNGDKA